MRTTSPLGFAFANPHPATDDYNTFDPKDVFAGTQMRSTPSPEPIPAPWHTPPVLALSDVLGGDAIAQIQTAGRIVFMPAATPASSSRRASSRSRMR